jgi:hypothetical protein
MKRTKRNILLAFALLLVVFITGIIITGSRHSLSLEVIRSGEGWGYDILKNNKIYIHQPYIPAIEGQFPFKDKKSARKTGKLVVKKLREHKLPSVSVDEVKEIIGE